MVYMISQKSIDIKFSNKNINLKFTFRQTAANMRFQLLDQVHLQKFLACTPLSVSVPTKLSVSISDGVKVGPNNVVVSPLMLSKTFEKIFAKTHH